MKYDDINFLWETEFLIKIYLSIFIRIRSIIYPVRSSILSLLVGFQIFNGGG